MSSEAVTAGEIKEFDPLSMLSDELAQLLLDRHPGVVADFLPQSGEGIEKSRLASVGVANNSIRFAENFAFVVTAMYGGVVRSRLGENRGADHNTWHTFERPGFLLHGEAPCTHHHLRRVSLTNTELKSPQTELHRITQRGAANKGDTCLGQ